MLGLSLRLIALGLLVCLDTVLALRAETSDWRRRAVRPDNGTSHGTSVAILLVGRTISMEPKSALTMSASGVAQTGTHQASMTIINLVDAMTGADDHVDSIKIRRRGKNRVSPWSTFTKHVLHPFNSEGIYPDVVVCTDNVSAAVPREVKQVFSLQARNQFERAYLCYRELLISQAYDFYIKARPDFVYLGDFPSVASFRHDRIHTRFRFAIGIRGLTSSHFSYKQCSKYCNGTPNWAVGYMNDDMFYVVPSDIADRVFVSQNEAKASWRRFKNPPNWPTMWPCNEGRFTKQLLVAGVQTEPLPVVGYPQDSQIVETHKRFSTKCASKPINKTRCGLKALHQ